MSDYTNEYENHGQGEGNIIDIDTSGATEPRAVSEGEQRVQIIGILKDKNTGSLRRSREDGSEYLILSLDLPNESNCLTFIEFLDIPNSKIQSPKDYQKSLWGFDMFKRAFRIDVLDLEQIVGIEADAIVGIKHSEEYGYQNYIKKWIGGA